MYQKVFFAITLSLLISSCGTLPSTKVKTNEFIQESPSLTEISSIAPVENIKLYERQYPKGVVKDGDLLQVKAGYEDKIEILGMVSVDLKKGVMTSPFPMGPKRFIYVNDDDLGSLHKYCKSMNVQDGLFMILMWIPNYLAPWNWPCYFQEDHGGESNEDLEYRNNTLEYLVKSEASRLGGNAVIGYSVGGLAYVNSVTGATVANTDSWSAAGYVVKFK
jgi:hypothetical protein